jgi:hypothetical protein
MARPRKSVQELKENGTFRPSRHGGREASGQTTPLPRPTAEAPAASLDVEAVRADLAKLLGRALSATDGVLLVELAERVVEVRRLRDACRAAFPGSAEHSRITRALTAATAALDRLAAQFGLTPNSRTALPAGKNGTALLGARTW